MLLQPGKREEIAKVEEDAENFGQLGILIDSEADCENDNKMVGEERFLLQTFTHPFFTRDTFFLEILERRGARGFGAGNILALAQSIIEYGKKRQREDYVEARQSI